jgi:hypothetical protein
MSAGEGEAGVRLGQGERLNLRVGRGNFTPGLPQIPDVNLAIHPARAAREGCSNQAVRPLRRILCSARGWSHLHPWHHRRGSHFPKSPIEIRAAYRSDTAWAVSGIS